MIDNSFIKLTSYYEDAPIYIRKDYVVSVSTPPSDEKRFNAYVGDVESGSWMVKETVDEVMAMLLSNY